MNTYVHGITNCTFHCNDFDAMVKFYRDTLEMPHVFTLRDEKGRPSKTCLMIAERQFVVLVNKPYAAGRDWGKLSCTHIAVIVEDIFAHTKMLEAKGVLITKGPSVAGKIQRVPYACDSEIAPCGSYAAWVRDPEGNEIEFMQYTQASMQLSCYPG